MQAFEFKKSIENNPFALTTNSLTILIMGGDRSKFKFLIRECLPHSEITKSLSSKMCCSILTMFGPTDFKPGCSAETLFALYFLIENESSFPLNVAFLRFNNLDSREMEFMNEHCPRFGMNEEHIRKYSDIAERHLAFEKYDSCPIVSVLQGELPYVNRVSARSDQFSHGKTDLVIKKYSYQSSYKYVINELEFHRKYSHPNILGILDYHFNLKKYEITLVMEYKNGAGYLPRNLKDIQSYMSQLLNACVYMRRNFVTHHNLKPDNIIYDSTDCVLKIIDFEFCRLTSGHFSTGNSFYRAPEKCNCESVGPSSDMYSVGIIFQSLIKYNFETMATVEPWKSAQKLMLKMLCTDKEDRIDPLSALENEFFTIN